MAEPRTCPECKRALGHRPGDCHERVSRGGKDIGLCECRCIEGKVPLDASGFYWPNHDWRRDRAGRPSPTFVDVGGHLVEPTHPKAIAQARADYERPRWPRRSRTRPKPVLPVPPPVPPPVVPAPLPPKRTVLPPPVVTVPTRREQLIAEHLAEMKKRRR